MTLHDALVIILTNFHNDKDMFTALKDIENLIRDRETDVDVDDGFDYATASKELIR